MDGSLDGSAITSLLALPPELLEALAAWLLSLLNGPALLARLSLTCTQMHQLCHSTAFLCARGHEFGTAGVVNLQQLGVLEALKNLGTHRVVFMGADIEIRPGSLARLKDFASLLKQHEDLTVAVEAHTGRNAPVLYAPAFTRARAIEIKRVLTEVEGVPAHRVTSATGWGKDVAVAAGWAAGIESARGELYFELCGLVMPPRPSYYEGLVPPVIMAAAYDDEDGSDGSGDGDSDGVD